MHNICRKHPGFAWGAADAGEGLQYVNSPCPLCERDALRAEKREREDDRFRGCRGLSYTKIRHDVERRAGGS